MEHAVLLPQEARGDVGIEFCRRDAGVAEHLLDVPQSRPALEQVGREAMPEGVRAEPAAVQARRHGRSLHDPEHAAPREPAAAPGDE